MQLPSQIALRCRYCNVATTEAVREVCRACSAHHEPDEHMGEYGVPQSGRRTLISCEPPSVRDVTLNK
jgi:hypothetical protein